MTATVARVTVFGVHAGLQNTSMESLRALWRRVEDLGFGWISVWDHFYPISGSEGAGSYDSVASHSALAMVTSRVRIGVLVYSVGYRRPAVLANAIATIDQLSGGRAEASWSWKWRPSKLKRSLCRRPARHSTPSAKMSMRSRSSGNGRP